MIENPYKQNTTLNAICEIMIIANRTRSEIEVAGLTDKHGRPLPRANLSMSIKHVKAQCFPDLHFYTRTNLEGRLVLGVR